MKDAREAFPKFADNPQIYIYVLLYILMYNATNSYKVKETLFICQ